MFTSDTADCIVLKILVPPSISINAEPAILSKSPVRLPRGIVTSVVFNNWPGTTFSCI